MPMLANPQTTMFKKMALPRQSSASATEPSPILMAARALPPAPNHMAKAFMTVMIGKATVVMATASDPTPWPRKIVLITL